MPRVSDTVKVHRMETSLGEWRKQLAVAKGTPEATPGVIELLDAMVKETEANLADD